jgi:hypothetical protein
VSSAEELERARAVLDRVEAGEVLVAPRDASCYDFPSTSSGPRSHSGGRYHVVTAAHGGASACSGALLVIDVARRAADTDRELMCRRSACYARWWAVQP